MNVTGDILSIPNVCEICQISHGFSSADRRAIIVMVVLTGIPLILCYIGVIWYAIRTRYIPHEKSIIIPEIVYANPIFDNDEVQYGDIEENMQNTVNITATQPAVLTIENERERY